ncbi:DUF4198 domain-containing protein [Sphingomonas montanisoli]|uniref:DUF4198 domain-containing protein n=2 Tax=Sphingomonas montanisoli TaxID=2606412 RepID=A0A5D9CDC2_9SPHN|nr:DUF4198 domain-containing protein [Sphingomonas montanisoli]
MAAPALAHMPYIAPAVFDVGQRDKVAIEASFTEDAFRPEIVMNDAPFEVTGPDGATRRLPAPAAFADRAVAEATLPADGIYRLSSGQRFGRMNQMYRDGTDWKFVAEGVAPPAGAELRKVQSATLADAYVLRGKPGTTGALGARNAALEIHPLADPTAIGAGDAFALEVLYRGKPLAGANVTLFREAGLYDGRKTVGEVKSGADGKLSVSVPDAGRYLLLVRHRDAAPAGADAPHYSYTMTLAFEAT